MTLETVARSQALSRKARADTARMVHHAKASHIGSCYSMADLLGVLYSGVLRVDPHRPDAPERDRFILSKGHGAAILYATLAEAGFFDRTLLDAYGDTGSPLLGHASHFVRGIELSTGSLGHGLPVGCGLALAAKRDGGPQRVYVLLSDGELDEGSNWEAILFAGHHRLDNLVAIVDYNKIQSFGRVDDVLGLEPLADKWRAFGWHVIEVDGHDHGVLWSAFDAAKTIAGMPVVLLAHTTKGKGVGFMEDDLSWHYRSPNADQLKQALDELGAGE